METLNMVEYGVINRDGAFFPCSYGEHGLLLMKLLKAKTDSDARMKADEQGYIVIKDTPHDGIQYVCYRRPSPEQLATCRDHADRNNMEDEFHDLYFRWNV